MTAAEVAERLRGHGLKTVKTKSGFKVCCPVHNDRTPSLELADGKSKLVWYCFAGCSNDDVRSALARMVGDDGQSSGRSSPRPIERRVAEDPIEVLPRVPDNARIGKEDFVHHQYGHPSSIWTYRHADGAISGWVARYDLKDGSKEVLPYSWCLNRQTKRQELRMKAQASPRPLYQLPKIVEDRSSTILFVEGEKAADAGQKMFPGWVATTLSGGGNAIQFADLEPLEGRTVVIMPDHDGPGYQLVHELVRRLSGRAKLRLLVWPDHWPQTGEEYKLRKGDDVADHLEQGWSADLLKDFCAKAGRTLTFPIGLLPPGLQEEAC